ncbi:hypothetical protein TRVL_05513 [Trypanosoma vivax]|nr:hypothetical protein TRVL_05513 [Trypanosoma vivax]
MLQGPRCCVGSFVAGVGEDRQRKFTNFRRIVTNEGLGLRAGLRRARNGKLWQVLQDAGQRRGSRGYWEERERSNSWRCGHQLKKKNETFVVEPASTAIRGRGKKRPSKTQDRTRETALLRTMTVSVHGIAVAFSCAKNLLRTCLVQKAVWQA